MLPNQAGLLDICAQAHHIVYNVWMDGMYAPMGAAFSSKNTDFRLDPTFF